VLGCLFRLKEIEDRRLADLVGVLLGMLEAEDDRECCCFLWSFADTGMTTFEPDKPNLENLGVTAYVFATYQVLSAGGAECVGLAASMTEIGRPCTTDRLDPALEATEYLRCGSLWVLISPTDALPCS